MPVQKRFFFVLAILIAGAVLASLERVETDVSLSSVSEIWADVLRDTDQFGFQLTRVSDQKEMRIGTEIKTAIQTWGTEDPEAAKYVTAVAQTMLPHIRQIGRASCRERV